MPSNPISVRINRTNGARLLRVNLMLKFDPKELGKERTAQLLSGLVKAVADVISPEERNELLRQVEAERRRLTAAA